MKNRIKNICLLIFPFFLLTFGTLAFLISRSEINNDFVIGSVKTEIVNEDSKKNISVKNIGNVPIYIRVYLNIEKRSEGVTIYSSLLNNEYNLVLSNSSNWIKIGDYYYYKLMVKPNDVTDVLINIFSKNSEDIYLDITSQAIQANPSRAVIDAWGISVSNGEIEGAI